MTGATSVLNKINRPISGNTRNVTVALVAPGTMFGDRLNQLDYRISKSVKVSGVSLQGQVDIYNVLNANPVLTYNNTFGVNWLRPTGVLAGRLVKLGMQLNF